MKVVHLTIRNRATVVGFSILIVGLGVILVTFGMALLAALAVTGTLVGAVATIYRKLRRKVDRDTAHRLSGGEALDPSLEVRPSRPPSIAPLRSPDK